MGAYDDQIDGVLPCIVCDGPGGAPRHRDKLRRHSLWLDLLKLPLCVRLPRFQKAADVDRRSLGEPGVFVRVRDDMDQMQRSC